MTIMQSILAFSVTAGLLTITPSLDTVLVLRTAAVEGSRRAMLAGLGVCCGVLAWGLLASIGLGAILALSELAYDALRIAGACYLVYLGFRLIMRPHGPPAERIESASATTDLPPDAKAGQWFIRGLLTNLLNPKVGVFYVTFLPQFIPSGYDVVTFSALLASIHAVEGIIWFAMLTLATRPLSHWLRRPNVTQSLDRMTGGLFILLGIRLALEDRR